MAIQNGIITLEANPGEHISDYASRCYNIAKRYATIVEGQFNGATFDTKGCSSARDVLKRLELELNKNQETYQKSDRYKDIQAATKQKTKQQQVIATKLVGELDALNWSSFSDILDWLCNIQQAADYVGVSIDTEKIVQTFKKNGFFTNVNTDDDFDGNDEENVARYIIGQALDGFETVGAPHPVLLSFVEKWKTTRSADIEEVVI